MRWVLALLLGLQLAITATPSAAAPAGSPRRIAILIGNWDYDLDKKFTDPTSAGYVSDLHNPCNDVTLIKRELDKAHFEIFDYCNVKQSEFTSRIQEFSTRLADLPKGSAVFVYYSGHGMQTAGRNFLIPVQFRWTPAEVNGMADSRQLEFFRTNANEVGALFRKLPDDPDIAVIVALDNCRDNPVEQKSAYNEAVSIRTPPNAVVFYATTAGDTTSDGGDGARNSDFARELAGQMATGRDLGDILSQTNIRIWQRFRAGRRDTYAELDTGPAFAAMRSLPLSVATPAAAPRPEAPQTALPRKTVLVRNVYDGMSLDILWCEGPGEAARFAYARAFADALKGRAHEFKVGRIQLKPLSEDINDHGNYGVYRNLMRYDLVDPKEREVLMNIAQAFPDANFLLRRGIGVHGKPTPNYVSAFICGRVGSEASD